MQDNTVITGKSHTVAAFGMTFTEGNEYNNYFGTYKVLSFVSDTHMQVQYTKAARSQVQGGQIAVYEMKVQAETISKEKRRGAAEMKLAGARVFSGDKDAFTLAYIKEHGHIRIEVPEKCLSTFAVQYKRITGHDLNSHLGKGFHLVKNENWWAVTMRVTLPYNDAVINKLALPEEGVHVYGNNVTISNNEFVRGLLFAGFRAGKNKDNEKLAALAA